jgi:hypothetical protein
MMKIAIVKRKHWHIMLDQPRVPQEYFLLEIKRIITEMPERTIPPIPYNRYH